MTFQTAQAPSLLPISYGSTTGDNFDQLIAVEHLLFVGDKDYKAANTHFSVQPDGSRHVVLQGEHSVRCFTVDAEGAVERDYSLDFFYLNFI